MSPSHMLCESSAEGLRVPFEGLRPPDEKLDEEPTVHESESEWGLLNSS